MREFRADEVHRGHSLTLWYDPATEEYVVTSNLAPDVTCPSDRQQCALRIARSYIDGWKDAGGA